MTPRYTRATVSLGMSGVNVRKGPGIKYQRFDALEPGHSVCIVEEVDNWVKIVYDNPDAAQGWSVKSAFVLESEVELPCDVEPPLPDVEPPPEKPLPPAKTEYFRNWTEAFWTTVISGGVALTVTYWLIKAFI